MTVVIGYNVDFFDYKVLGIGDNYVDAHSHNICISLLYSL